jgi:ABC-type lipoprotein export system ATPase subunit
MQRAHASPIIIAQGLSKTFQLGGQTVNALHEVTVSIPRGQFCAIVGASGSGKSTLLYLLGGLDRPSGGAIQVQGQRLDAMSSEGLARFRRDTIGFVFQQYHLVPSMNALQNVALPGVFAGLTQDARETRAAQLLDALRLAERLDHKPSQLSGGQQQRVAIARALFNDPAILMADEPTGALDSRTGQHVMQMLRTLADRHGKTVLVVTHDQQVAAYADRQITLLDGQIVSDELQTPQSQQTHEQD